ncbi:MAG: hypothetical protein R3B46_07030 [Phycisphaerales bacterium]
MKRFIAITVMASLAGAASAGTVSQVVPFDYDPSQGIINPVISGFDTMGGTRQLNSVRFDFNHNFSADLFVESTGPTAVSAGDFFVSSSFISILQLGTIDGGDGEGSIVNGGPPGPPFFGPGAFFIDNVTGDLAAYDNIPGNNGPDSFTQSFSDSYANSWEFLAGDDQSVLDALTDTGDVTTVYGGFQELSFFWVNDPSWPPPDFFPEYPDTAAIWVSFQQYRHFGDFTVTYDYSVVPSPGALGALIGGIGLMSRRRR